MWDATFFYTAIAGGAVLALQFVLMFFGGGQEEGGGFGEGHGDAGHSHSPGAGDGQDSAGSKFFEMLSLRTLAACALFFGLVGMTARSYEASVEVSLLLGGLAGFVAMYSVYWMFQWLFRLESSGNQEIINAVGLPAKVYLRIPGRNSGRGKVHLTMQQRRVEYPAVTEEAEAIPTGEHVWVADVVSGDTLRIVRETPPQQEDV